MIKVKNLTKSYLYNGKRSYIFKNLNFTIKDGESVGLLGGNGAGKSTLLRLIGGIDIPDSGTIEKNCKVSWPFGVAAGFQGSLSARENVIFVSKIYSSHSKKEIQKKVEIVRDFAEIGEYFDKPYKTYSSGMKNRVSFGLSLAFDFDVYLLDEVTAKGDVGFRSKCKKALNKLRKKSSFIIVSHNYDFLEKYSDKAYLMYNKNLKEYSNLQKALKDCTKLLTKKSKV